MRGAGAILRCSVEVEVEAIAELLPRLFSRASAVCCFNPLQWMDAGCAGVGATKPTRFG